MEGNVVLEPADVHVAKKTLARGSASKPSRAQSDTLPAIPDSLVNRRVGNFVVERLLGQGAMGSVYLAVHDTLRRRVAVKVLQPHLALDEQLVQRFVDEAQIVSSLGHAGIAQIFDFGRLDDGQLYATMEYLDGKDLEDALAREGALSAGRVASIGVQVASALAIVHDQDIVHRDLKPANLFLAVDGEGTERVKILDFGIAKLDESTGARKRTAAGHVVGTPEYMAPEQASAAGNVDGRTDIYALGCVLYELLCGRPPHVANSIVGVLMAHANTKPEDISCLVQNLPEGLATVVMRCLAKDPERRWQSARELKAALLPYASELPEVASVVQTAPSLPGAPHRSRKGLVFGGLGILLAMALAYAATRRMDDPSPAAEGALEAVVSPIPDAGEVATAEPQGNPFTSDDSMAIAEGAAIYASSCAGCHGDNGEGDGELAPVDSQPKAFAHMQVPAGTLDAYRFEIVRRGVDEVMPSFSEKLSISDTWKVVSYLSALSSREIQASTSDDLWSIRAPRMTAKMARRGKKLYKRECSSCHGPRGRGNGPASGYLGRKPTNLVRGAYKLRTTDRDSLPTSEDLYRTLSQGMGVSGMPDFSKLSPEERWQVVAYLRTLNPRFSTAGKSEIIKVPKAPPMDDDAVRRGRAQYLAAGCAQCHGKKGLGDGPKAADLRTDSGDPILAANFTVPATFVGGMSPREIYRTMMAGMAGTPMPSGDNFFDEGEAWDVVAFILSLQK